MGVGDIIHHGISGGTTIRVREMDHVPVDWEDSGRISLSGGTETDRADAAYELVRGMGAPSHGGVNVGGGSAGGGDLRCLPSEHRHAIYYDKSHYGPVSGGGATPRGMGFGALVVTGGT